MKEKRGRSGSRLVGALVMLVFACGSRSRLELDSLGDGEGATAGTESAPAGNGGVSGSGGTSGASVTGGSSSGGSSTGGSSSGGSSTGGSSTGGSSTGGSSTGGTCSSADFDFSVEPDQAVAYMVDHAHSGAQFSSRIEPPLRQIWYYKLSGGVSYPIVADSHVFVAANATRLEQGAAGIVATVYAIDQATGRIPWRSEFIEMDPFGSQPVHLAYDRGLLFAASQTGTVIALDARTGAERWRSNVEDIDGSASMPIAAGGAVYLIGSTSREDATFGLDSCDGHVFFRSGAMGPGHPTLGGGTLFSTGSCHNTLAMNPRDGTALWAYERDCFGGGGQRTVYESGVLYVGEFEQPMALDTYDRVPRGYFDVPSALWPASVAADEVVVQSSHLGAHALNGFGPNGGPVRWYLPLPGFPWIPTLLTPGYAWVLAGGELEDWQLSDKFLYAVYLSSREIVWQSSEPTAPGDEHWDYTGTEPRPAIAAGGGRIFVAFNDRLVAYEPQRGVAP